MATTGSRTLQLLSLLQNHRYWPGTELADRLQVSPRTLRRDVDRLRELGYPVRSHRGVDGGYQLEAGAAMPPLLLDDEEAVGLTVALQTAAAHSVAGVAESSLRALAKLTQVMPSRLRRHVDALRAVTDSSPWMSPAPGPAPDTETLIAIALTCRDQERLRFGYLSRDGDASERHVEPLRLVSLGRTWYLVAYDLDRQDWRTFRADRIDAGRGTGSRFAARPLPGGDAVAFVRSGILRSRSLLDVVAVIDAPGEQVQGRLGQWATVTAVDDERCRVQLHAESLEWAVFALGSLGAEFRVEQPAELQQLLAQWAGRFARAVDTQVPTALR